LGVVVVVPLVLVAAQGDGFPTSRVELSSGGAWLVSPSQGLVTLIDGASDEVVGSVRAPAARRGDALSVVQSGSSAYVVNASQGTVARVDGGTYEVSAPVRFGDGRGSLEVFAGSEVLYVVDGVRRKASETDPVSLAVRRELSLAAQPGPGQSVVDGAGRLWVVDGGGGGVSWFDEGVKRVRPGVGDGRSRLVLVQGGPVLVDTSQGRVGRLGGSGKVRSWSCLEVREGDEVQVLGSATSARVVAAVKETGTLVVSAVGRDECGTAVEVGRPGDEFGPLVESGGFVFVPNRSSGATAVVELATARVVARFDLVKPRNRVDLLAKDGLVFYNDLDGNRAGVIRFDGTRWRKGKDLLKYDPAKLGRKLLGSDGHRSETSPEKIKPPAGDSSSKAAGPGSAPEAPEHDVPATTPPPGVQPSGPPATTSPARPRATAGPTRPSASRRPSPSPTTTRPVPLPRLRIVPSPASPEVDEQVTLQVVADASPRPVSANWDFGDGQTGTGLSTTHSWATDGTFQVTVQTRFPDGRTKSAIQPIDVTPVPVQLRGVDVNAPAINCKFEPSCTMTVGQDLATPIPLPTATGNGFLQSRTFVRPGQPGTVGAGLYPYVYRIALDNLTVAPGTPCIESLSIDFGPLVPLDFNGSGSKHDYYVVTTGGLGTVKPSSATQTGNRITFSFATPVCANDGVRAGETSFFFGLVSSYPKKPVTTRLTDTANNTYDLAGSAPAYP
jgi:hypothetical protein